MILRRHRFDWPEDVVRIISEAANVVLYFGVYKYLCRSHMYLKDNTSVQTSGPVYHAACKDEYRHNPFFELTADVLIFFYNIVGLIQTPSHK